MSVSWYLF